MKSPRQLLSSCLFTDEAIQGIDRDDPVRWAASRGLDAVLSPGVMRDFMLDARALRSVRGDLIKMLDRLPEEFRESGGGGHSFMCACLDGEWQHVDIEALVCLGNASGLTAYCMPREYWKALPGGLPYFVYKDKSGAADAASDGDEEQ